MSENKHDHFFRRALLAAWGMATLILFFCVVLLAREMIEEGRSPFDLSDLPETPESVTNQQAAAPAARKEVRLYFASNDSRRLMAESRPIEMSEFTAENCRAVLEALAEGSQRGLTPILPPSMEVRAVYLLPDGELVIDLPRDLIQAQPRSASAEALMVYGIVASVTQPAVKGSLQSAVRTVRFLIEGTRPSATFESHLDLSNAIAPDPEWIANPEVAPPEDV